MIVVPLFFLRPTKWCFRQAPAASGLCRTATFLTRGMRVAETILAFCSSQENGPCTGNIIAESVSPKRAFHSVEFSPSCECCFPSRGGHLLFVSVLNRLLTSIPPAPKHPRKYFSRGKEHKTKTF